MNYVTPKEPQDIVNFWNDFTHKIVDGTTTPLYVDYENQQIGAGTTQPQTYAASANAKLVVSGNVYVTGTISASAARITDIQLNNITATSLSVIGTAGLFSALNLTGNFRSTGDLNVLNITAGLLTITSTATLQSAINITGQLNSTGSINVLNITAGLLTITSTSAFNSAINITGQLNSTGSINVLNITGGLLTVTSTANLYNSINSTGISAIETLGVSLRIGATPGSGVALEVSGGGVNIRDNNGSPLLLNHSGNDAFINQQANAAMVFLTNNSERLRLTAAGNFGPSIAGFGFQVKEGSNATMGTVTLVGGAATASTTAVKTGTRIFVSNQGGGVVSNIGSIYATGIVNSTSFEVRSTNTSDTSTVAWLLIFPA